MPTFTLHTEETAPEQSKPTMKMVKDRYGFVPNLTRSFAESPELNEGYWALSDLFDRTDLSPAEREVILMSNNRLNGCHYCMAAHTLDAKMSGVPEDVIDALRKGTPIADPKLEVLRKFAIKMNQSRGYVSNEDMDALLAAGYTNRTIFDVVLGTGLKVLSNYTNHVANTPVDEIFMKTAWSLDEVVETEDA